MSLCALIWLLCCSILCVPLAASGSDRTSQHCFVQVNSQIDKVRFAQTAPTSQDAPKADIVQTKQGLLLAVGDAVVIGLNDTRHGFVHQLPDPDSAASHTSEAARQLREQKYDDADMAQEKTRGTAQEPCPSGAAKSSKIRTDWNTGLELLDAHGKAVAEAAIAAWSIARRHLSSQAPGAGSSGAMLFFLGFSVVMLMSFAIAWCFLGEDTSAAEFAFGRSLRAPGGKANVQQAAATDTSRQKVPRQKQEWNGPLCENLIVPKESECILAVPLISAASPGERLSIRDMYGAGVLSADVSLAQTRVTLQTPGSEVLAHGVVDSSAKVFEVQRASGDVFATVRRDNNLPDRYVLDFAGTPPPQLQYGEQLHLWGAFSDHAINVTSNRGRLLATTERCAVDFDSEGKYYRLLVSPDTDVGLLLSALLGVQLLERAGSSGLTTPNANNRDKSPVPFEPHRHLSWQHPQNTE